MCFITFHYSGFFSVALQCRGNQNKELTTWKFAEAGKVFNWNVVNDAIKLKKKVITAAVNRLDQTNK